MKHIISALFFCIILIGLSQANAQNCTDSTFYDDCPNGDDCWLNVSGLDSVIYYYIEETMASDLRNCTPSNDDDGLTDLQLRRVIHSAANIWNNQSSGRVLVYAGTATLGNVCGSISYRPAIFINWESCPRVAGTLQDCQSDRVANASLLTNAGCDGVASITIYGSKDNGQNIASYTNCTGNPHRMDWKLGSFVQSETSTNFGYSKNLQTTLVHEFGHTLGLGHSDDSTPTKVENSVMYTNYTTYHIPGEKRPHLWEWDRKCNNKNGGRILEYSYLEKNHHGAWSNIKEINTLWTTKGFFSGNYIRSVSNDHYLSYHIDVAKNIKYGPVNSDGVLNFSNNASLALNSLNNYFQPSFMTPLEQWFRQFEELVSVV